MGRKTSIGEAHDLVSCAWTLARMAVRAGVPYAEVAKVLRGAMKSEQARLDEEKRLTRRAKRRGGEPRPHVLTSSGFFDLDGIDSLELSVRAANECQRLGISSVEALAGWRPSYLRKREVGFKTIRELQAKLHERGLSLKFVTTDDWRVLAAQNGVTS